MTIIINGKTEEIAQNTTLKKVLLDLGLFEKVMASAVNMQIVKQDNWDNYILKDGDKLELLDFVGGG
jgi:sulfur carrier protein